jgi:short-subunit dehydrogenase
MSKPVVLITGASQGIGAAIARVFSQQIKGVKLALVARNQSRLNAVSRGCSEHGAAVETYCCDVSDSNEVELLKEAVLKKYKHIDVLINNAGVFKAASFLDMEVEMFDDLIDTNLRSVFLVSKAFVPSMVERKRGDIFNMSSIAGLIAYSGGSGYSAAKFGVTGLSKVMRAELKTYGIKVCCVCPGATVSPSWRGSNIPQQRLMPAEDVARAFYDIYCLSKRTVVEEIVLRPMLGDL